MLRRGPETAESFQPPPAASGSCRRRHRPVTGSPARGRTRLPRHASPATPAPPYVLHGACPPPLVANPEPAAARAERVCHEGGPGLSTRWNRAARGVRELVGAAYEQVGAHIAQTHLRLTAEAGHHSQPPVNLLPEGQHEPLSRSRPPQRQTWAVDKGWNRTARGVRVVMGAAYEQGGAQVAQTNLRLTAEAGHHSQTPVNL